MTEISAPMSKGIIPLILCGGSGSRLWPLSRWNKPKQFLRLTSQHSLLESTLLRCRADVFAARPIIVGSQSHAKTISDAIHNLGIDAEIVLEPERRDSCAAIVAGVLVAAKRDPDALVMMMAADHDIPDAAAFANAASQAASAAAQGHIVTFGVKPLNPATGYGYILPGMAIPSTSVFSVSRFVEKPDIETAKHYMKHGYLWNSGNFMFLAKALLEDVSVLAPLIFAAISKAVAEATLQAGCVLLNKQAFAAAPRISFDYAVMEKTKRAAVLPVGYAWSDIGTWDAVASMSPKDAAGNYATGEVTIENSRNVYVNAQGVRTVVLGCNDISVITTPDAVLVVGKGHSEDIKRLLDALPESEKI